MVQIPGLGLSLTAVDSGLLSTLQPSQISLSLFLSSPDGATVTGTGVILPYPSTGTSFLKNPLVGYVSYVCALLLRFVEHKEVVANVDGNCFCETKARYWLKEPHLILI